jgi:hypothetical protein
MASPVATQRAWDSGRPVATVTLEVAGGVVEAAAVDAVVVAPPFEEPQPAAASAVSASVTTVSCLRDIESSRTKS